MFDRKYPQRMYARLLIGLPEWPFGILLGWSAFFFCVWILNLAVFGAEATPSSASLVPLLQKIHTAESVITQDPSGNPIPQDSSEKHLEQVDELLRNLQLEFNDRHFEKAGAVLQQLVTQTFNPESREFLKELGLEVRKQQLEEEILMDRRLQEMLESLSSRSQKLTNPEEVDPLIEEILIYQLSHFPERPKSNALSFQSEISKQRIQRALGNLEIWRSFLSQVQSQHFQEALDSLNELLAKGKQSAFFQKSFLKETADRLIQKLVADIENGIHQLPDKVTEFNKAGKMDELMELLTQWRSQLLELPIQSESVKGLLERVERARTTLQWWENLQASEIHGGNPTQLEKVKALESISKLDFRLIPPGLVDERVPAVKDFDLNFQTPADQQFVKKVDDFLGKITNLKDVRVIVFQLRNYKEDSTLTQGMREILDLLIEDLDRLSSLNDSLELGQYSLGLELKTKFQSHPWSGKIQALREEIMMGSLSHIYSFPNFSSVQGNNLSEKLMWITDQYVQGGDWDNALLALDAFGEVSGLASQSSSPQWFKAETAGIQNYLAGKKLEAAGEREAAIQSYLEVIKQVGGKRIPVQEALERIKVLRSEPSRP